MDTKEIIKMLQQAKEQELKRLAQEVKKAAASGQLVRV